MKGIVTMELNERQQNPGVNSPISTFYSKNQVVDISEAIVGDPYDGNDLWYRLKNGAYVWSGAVELVPECERVKELDKQQFLLSYRQIESNGRININTKNPAKELYFVPLALPATSDSINVNKIIPGAFANFVVQSVKQLKDPRRNHVFIYIHGFQAFPSLKLDLFTHFVENYMSQDQNKIAKVMFMVWPAQGLGRKKADNRALEAGREFTENNCFDALTELSSELKKNGMHLNLIVHSFGHQLLNGMINANVKAPDKIFENIFLMASDITHLALQQGGVELRDYFPNHNKKVPYKYGPLRDLGNNIYVFYNDLDLLLYASTKKFVASRDRDDPTITESYSNLGNFGGERILPPRMLEAGFNFISVPELVKNGQAGELLNYPYRDTSNHTKRIVQKARDQADYSDVNLLDIIFNLPRYPNYHRYLFTCKPVISKVNELLA